jgi:endonuclease/exonuclease/phosphatase family metal-dependent hydrolase
MKIFTLNLNYYADKHGDWNRRKKLIAETLREHAPDIVAFQAVCSDPEINAGVNQADQLGGLLPEYRYRHFFVAGRRADGRQEGNAVISRIAPVETEQFLLSLPPGTDDTTQRLVAKSVFARGSDSFTLFIGHFSWIAEQAENNAREAVDYLTRACNFLLVGDLNTDPKKSLLQPFRQAGFVDVWEKFKGDEEGFTFESNEPFTRIDYAWIDAGLADAVQDIEVIKEERNGVRMSDHLGLLVKLDI